MPAPQKDVERLRQRVVRAAEAALADQSYVGLLDVFTGMGFLSPNALAAWRKGIIETLDPDLQVGAEKLVSTIRLFHEWVAEKGLEPREAEYVRRTREGLVQLRYSDAPDHPLEQMIRRHYIPANLPPAKQKKIAEKGSKPPELVVYQILRDSECSECGAEIEKNELLLMEAGKPLCLSCAGLGDLEFLAAGDAALTRRSSKYSERKAVVVRFSHSRGRYGRQGILVEVAAIERAEQECSEDAPERAKARAADAERRRKQDIELTARMADRIRELFPGCPPKEAAAIAAHTAVRGSGRVGRSASGQRLDERAMQAAVRAAIRHQNTVYDELLAGGVDRELARQRVAGNVDEILAQWSE